VPWTSVVAAVCLIALLGAATLFHSRRGETQMAGITGMLGGLAILVTIGLVT